MNENRRSNRRMARRARRVSLPLVSGALARNDRPGLRRRTYVADRVVLTIVEHDAPATPDPRVDGHGEPDPALPTGRLPHQLRTVIEALAGRRITATLSGQQADPRVSFALFLLQD